MYNILADPPKSVRLPPELGITGTAASDSDLGQSEHTKYRAVFCHDFNVATGLQLCRHEGGFSRRRLETARSRYYYVLVVVLLVLVSTNST